MAGGENTAALVQLSQPLISALIAQLIMFFGNRRTGLSGTQKMNTIVETVAPLAPVAATIASGNSSDPLHKLEIQTVAQGIHDGLLSVGAIQPTSVLEAQPASPVGQVIQHVDTPPISGTTGEAAASATPTPEPEGHAV